MSLSALLAQQARLSVQNYSGMDGSAIDSDDEDDVSCNEIACTSSSYDPTPPAAPSLAESISSAGTTSTITRRNEHLAVLIPKHLWKPDSQAANCDFFHCRKSFSLFERRHHCRKCGGVFCAQCSAQSMPLLDTCNLSFFYPPRNVPLSVFESASSPIVDARVCTECWDQVNGFQTPRTPELLASPIPCRRQLASSNSSIISTPPDILSHFSHPLIRRSQAASGYPQIPPPPPSPTLSADQELGELAAYPLRHSSAVCKKTGGGRWCPKKVTTIEGYRIPGCKAQYEIDLEREEAESRLLKSNPLFKDGDFQYRVPREIEPQSLRGGPFVLSTF